MPSSRHAQRPCCPSRKFKLRILHEQAHPPLSDPPPRPPPCALCPRRHPFSFTSSCLSGVPLSPLGPHVLCCWEDPHSFCRAALAGRCVSLVIPRPPPQGGRNSCLCSHTNSENTNYTIYPHTLRPESSRVDAVSSGPRTVPRGYSQQPHMPSKNHTPSCVFTQHSSSIINTQLVSLCCLSFVR